MINSIVTENLLTGSPRSEWDVSVRGSTAISGFSTEMSVNHGDTIQFKIDSGGAYNIEIYRLGYYDGDGARLITTIDNVSGTVQPDPIRMADTGVVDAGNWNVSAHWDVPVDMTSGVFLAKLVRQDGSGESLIPFIVRADESKSDIVFQTSDMTWQAYNTWGSTDADGNGASLYGGDSPPDRAYAVSYNRPFVTRDAGMGESGSTMPNPWNYILGPEFSAIYWLEKNGYDVSYVAGADTDRYGSLLLNHNAFLSVGHDEYWSGTQRANVEAARDAGVNLMFWSGNEVYWRTHWETSVDGSGQAYRTIVCYKESYTGDIDPSNEWTGTFRDGRFTSPSAIGGGIPENALTGTMFGSGYDDASNSKSTIEIPYELSQFRFWNNTDVQNTQVGGVFTLGQNLLKYEWDISPDNGFRPAGLIPLSSTTVFSDSIINAYGTQSTTGTATHNLTLYKDPESGALVFGAGSVFWSFALGGDMDTGTGTAPDRNVQQAMVNLFAEMGIQPGTLEASLILATASADATAPTSTLEVAGGLVTIRQGALLTITGTATDNDGNAATVDGKVAAVEVSTDGGASWHVANGTTNWSYGWTASGLGQHEIKVRPVDDSLNLQMANAASLMVNVTPRTIGGDSNANVLIGANDQDWIFGGAGNDKCYGNGGNDFVCGGAGVDQLWGGAGANRFVFEMGDTGNTAYTRDIIGDFVKGQDKINLSAIDANINRVWDQAFNFSGKWGGAYSIWTGKYDNPGTANDKTIVFGDYTGDGKADFQIELTKIISLTKADFIL
ncbi:MAG TPA: M10 family metallopeptidase C-terminal domain-containing protein [Hyphomicrobium sp.]|nr:M10 family metallopeptidase C-terminal domain-containing protein [Hyphomicrobium sp.]